MELVHCYESLVIPLGGGHVLRLDDDSRFDRLAEPVLCAELPEGWLGTRSERSLAAPSPRDRPPFCFLPTAPERGLAALRLFELREYAWEVIAAKAAGEGEVVLTSSLQQSALGGSWKSRKVMGRFSFVNYLGSAWIEANGTGLATVRLCFDVASPKLDYEQEYRAMVESIGTACQQLLLDWGTPTALNISPDPERRVQTLLEQFLFLRNVLGPDKLDLYLEVLQRNPHARLEIERCWKPAGGAAPVAFVRDPLRNGRDWRLAGGGYTPGEIREERKYNSTDTPPNRFVKFALESFRSLCDEVISAQRGGKPAFAPGDTVYVEASAMRRSLDGFLALTLIDSAGELQRIPFESTTLQRREGYREILLAWLMLDAAAQIDWPGRQDAYDGTNRDVATLYEFWLYFELVRALEEDIGMELLRDSREADGALPFCCLAADGRLRINMKQGKASYTNFKWTKDGVSLKVHFFYNREFGRQPLVNERGSYSKTFRPDYTLVIFPDSGGSLDWEEAERTAEGSGQIAYLHFDAKYRGENLAGIFGADDDGDDGKEERVVRASGAVKNADLYKMHTYNEAIRRTVGSYVLYPGAAPDVKEANARYSRYHELIPGVGAFALRPKPDGSAPDGLSLLCDFITDILNHQLNRFTQSYRISSATEGVIREMPLKYTRSDHVTETIALPAANVVLGYMKKADTDMFREGTAQSEGPFFYCRAADDEQVPLAIDISAPQGSILVGWSGPRAGPWHTVDWMARIVSCRLVLGATLKAETGHAPSDPNRHYLLFRLSDVSNIQSRDVTKMVRLENATVAGGMFRSFQSTLGKVMQCATVTVADA